MTKEWLLQILEDALEARRLVPPPTPAIPTK